MFILLNKMENTVCVYLVHFVIVIRLRALCVLSNHFIASNHFVVTCNIIIWVIVLDLIVKRSWMNLTINRGKGKTIQKGQKSKKELRKWKLLLCFMSCNYIMYVKLLHM